MENRVTDPSPGVQALFDLVAVLRRENGCPWDRRQTPRSIAVYLIEEVFELVAAIEAGDHDHACEELGDVLFLIVFTIAMYRESDHFGIEDVIRGSLTKMTRRHPHVFGRAEVVDTAAVKKQWREIKAAENSHAPPSSVLDAVPRGLPAMLRAYRLSERAAGVGFDWNDSAHVMEKVAEEWREFQAARAQAASTDQQEAVAEEFGDLLFTLVNVARFAHIHPETALTRSIQKFERRFRHMEHRLADRGQALTGASQGELDRLWEDAKQDVG